MSFSPRRAVVGTLGASAIALAALFGSVGLASAHPGIPGPHIGGDHGLGPGREFRLHEDRPWEHHRWDHRDWDRDHRWDHRDWDRDHR
jgi:hypothetical protein